MDSRNINPIIIKGKNAIMGFENIPNKEEESHSSIMVRRIPAATHNIPNNWEGY
jgi:hypothetical protein